MFMRSYSYPNNPSSTDVVSKVTSMIQLLHDQNEWMNGEELFPVAVAPYKTHTCPKTIHRKVMKLLRYSHHMMSGSKKKRTL